MYHYKASILTNEELYQRYIDTNDPRILSVIIENNLKGIWRTAMHYAKSFSNVNYEDMLQEAALGYYEGLKRYDPTRNVKVNSYCTVWAKKYVMDYLNTHKYTVRMPRWRIDNKEKQKVEDATDSPYLMCKEDEEFIETKSSTLLEQIINQLPLEMQRSVIDAMSDRISNKPLLMSFKKLVKNVSQESGFVKPLVAQKSLMITTEQYEFWEHGQFEGGMLFIKSKPILSYYQETLEFEVRKKKNGYLLVIQ